jgi:uncharacterized protein YndB with AHSA1/START domain
MARRSTRSVSHQYFIQASPKKVFRAITDPKWVVRWLADTAEMSPRKGGTYAVGWNNGPQHRGTFLEFVPGKSVTMSWEWEGVNLHGTRFRLSVSPKGKGALLEIEHSGFPKEPAWVDLYGGTEWGWTYFAMNLKSVLETGHDLRSNHDG